MACVHKGHIDVERQSLAAGRTTRSIDVIVSRVYRFEDGDVLVTKTYIYIYIYIQRAHFYKLSLVSILPKVWGVYEALWGSILWSAILSMGCLWD